MSAAKWTANSSRPLSTMSRLLWRFVRKSNASGKSYNEPFVWIPLLPSKSSLKFQVYAWKVYERWFGSDEKCTKANVLALVVLDGMVNDARKIPYVRLHTGSFYPFLPGKFDFSRWNKAPFLFGKYTNRGGQCPCSGSVDINLTLDKEIEILGWPLQIMLENLVDDIGYAMHELYELNGEPRNHHVPK